jgi:hypothetical protein
MLLPWYRVGKFYEFEESIPDFAFFYFQWLFFVTGEMNSALKRLSWDNDTLFIARDILLGISGSLLFIYLIYNLAILLKKVKSIKSKILIPTTLIGMIAVFSSKLMYLGPRPGFWMISLGLLSSAVLEWVNARSVDYSLLNEK